VIIGDQMPYVNSQKISLGLKSI